jgi:hypothetical protein
LTDLSAIHNYFSVASDTTPYVEMNTLETTVMEKIRVSFHRRKRREKGNNWRQQ